MSRELGRRIADLLHSKGMLQKELAERIGLTEAIMSRYFPGKRDPKPEVLANISTVLCTSSNYLLGKVNIDIESKTMAVEIDQHKLQAVIDQLEQLRLVLNETISTLTTLKKEDRHVLWLSRRCIHRIITVHAPYRPQHSIRTCPLRQNPQREDRPDLQNSSHGSKRLLEYPS